jgi:hypothetical protein
MRHLVKIEKSVTSGELFWRELGRASFPQNQFTLSDRFCHLHLALMQDTYNLVKGQILTKSKLDRFKKTNCPMSQLLNTYRFITNNVRLFSPANFCSAVYKFKVKNN